MAARDIERLIRAQIPDAEVTIRDLAGDGDHYAATVIAESFRGKSRSVGWKATASRALSKSPSKSTVRSRSFGPARKTSSTICIGLIGSTVYQRVSTRTGCRSPGTIASQVPRSSRDGRLPSLGMVSIPTPPRAQLIWSTPFRTRTSSMSTGHSDRLLAQRRALTQRFRDRELYR